MPIFIELTHHHNGEKFFINPEKIQHMRRQYESNPFYTWVVLSGKSSDSHFYVKETPEEIMEMIKNG